MPFFQQILLFSFLLLLISKTENGGNCYVIMPYSTENNKSYQSTQIVPPAKYRLILWDNLSDHRLSHRSSSNGDNRRSSCHRDEMFCYFCAKPEMLLFYTDVVQFRLNELGKCFVHFHTVETDEKGRFLVHKSKALKLYHFYILPIKNSNPISADDFAPYAEQRIISQGNLKFLRNSFDDYYLLRYFESKNAMQIFVNDLLGHWLSDGLAYDLSQKQNFFLIAIFQYLIDYANRHINIKWEMAAEEAKLIGTFWDRLSEAANADLMWKQLKVADQRIDQLTNQFCQINKQYLMSQLQITVALRNVDNAMAFCQKWFVAQSKAKSATQIKVVIDAFRNWIYETKQLNFAFAEIVHFWVELFSKKTATKNIRRICQWSEFDQRVFRQLGILFAKANENYAIKLKTLNKIFGIKTLLDNICANVKELSVPCCAHNSIQNIMEQWKTTVCGDGKFRYLLHPKEQSNKSKAAEMTLYQNRQLSPLSKRHQLNGNNNREGEQRPKCVICLTEEIRFALDPCGHLCVCRECSVTIQNQTNPKCPLCREKTTKAIRIYQP